MEINNVREKLVIKEKVFYICVPFLGVRDVAQPGSALRSGRRGRWFESSHPDKKMKPFKCMNLKGFLI